MPINVSQLPNLLTISRIAAAPVLILMLKDRDYASALVVFIVAGLSDALDGWIAKRFRYTSRLGAILDPIADKVLLLSSYLMLMLLGNLPFWLLLTVAFRDLLIVGGYVAYTSVVGPVQMRPSLLSKFNTFMQILLILAVLAHEAIGLHYPPLLDALVYVVFLTTVASGMHYVWVWGVRREAKRRARARSSA